MTTRPKLETLKRKQGNKTMEWAHVGGCWLLLLLLFCGSLPATCDHQPKWFTVSLNDPPDTRWTEVIRHHRDIIENLESVFKHYIPSFVYPFVDRLAAEIDNYLPQPFSSEIKGIARELNASVGVLVLENILYDITAFCTSIVAQDSNGTIWHARNMDYHFTDKLKNNTVNINFVKDGKAVYQVTTYAGYIGALTGQKPRAFSLTLNERKEGALWMNVLMLLLTRRHSLSGFLLRETLASSDTYEAAVEHLSTTPTVAPAYYILGGIRPGQGVVITKSRLGADLWSIQPESGRWYVLETNYDHWLPAPPDDDRRTPAMKMMNQTGKAGINAATLYHILSTPPVLQTITIYTTVMVAAQPDIYKTCIRDNTTKTEGC